MPAPTPAYRTVGALWTLCPKKCTGSLSICVSNSRTLFGTQVLIQRLAANAELPCQLCFVSTWCDPLLQGGNLCGRQRLFAPSVDAALPGQCDARALPLTQQRALELRKGPHDRQHEVRHRRVLTGECQVFLHKRDA